MIFNQNKQVRKQIYKQNFNLKKRIGLMGPYGGNLGDAAIQQAMIQNIYKYFPDAQIYGFSLDPQDTENRHKIPSFPITRFHGSEQWWLGDRTNQITMILYRITKKLKSINNSLVRKIGSSFFGFLLEILAIARAYKNIKGLDIFIVSGGGQLDDYWGGSWAHPYTLLLWGILAKLRKVKYVMVSVGAGPIDSRLSRLFIRGALSLAHYRSYRDEDSKKFIAKIIGFKNDEDPVYPDLAHSLQLIQEEKSSSQKKRRLVVGINPIPYFDPRNWPQKDSLVYWNYLNELASLVSWLIEKQYTILFFSGCPYGDPPAIKDLREILEKNGVVYSEEQIIEEKILTVDKLMSQLSITDLVVATRFHGVLLSLLANKPVLALSYHPKIDKLMEDRGQSEYCLPIDRFKTEDLQEKFLKLETDCESIKQQLAKRTQDYRVALDEQYESIFSNL
jgi:polysaccharide pyruvyl transferase WcaK-like protein